MASPLFRLNGGAPGVKLSVAAGGAVVAQLDDLTGVDTAEWSVVATDETALPASYPLTISGPKNSVATTAALGAGTAAIIECRINGGINKATQRPDPGSTLARAKFFVPASNGAEVICAGELLESDPIYGYTGIINASLRASGGGGGSSGSAKTSGTTAGSHFAPAVGAALAVTLVDASWCAAGQVLSVGGGTSPSWVGQVSAATASTVTMTRLPGGTAARAGGTVVPTGTTVVLSAWPTDWVAVPAEDAAATFLWELNDPAGTSTIQNAAPGGVACPLSVTSGTATFGWPGVCQDALLFNGTSSSSTASVEGSPGVNPTATTAFTSHVWVWPFNYTNWTWIFGKRADQANWVSPNRSAFSFYFSNTGDGSLILEVSYGTGTSFTSLQLTVNAAQFRPSLRQWSHLGLTWDGNNLKGYVNGVLAGTANVAGGPQPINWSQNGYWGLGAVPQGSSGTGVDILSGALSRPTVVEAVWSAAQMRSYFLQSSGRYAP